MTIYVKEMISECDFTGNTYPTPVEGAHLLAKGASGCYAPIMFVGPEYIAQHGLNVVDYDDAVEMVSAMPDAFVGF